MNKINERTLRLMHNDYENIFNGILEIKNEVTFHIKNNQNPAGNCMFKVNNRNTRTKCEICSKLTIKTPERR